MRRCLPTLPALFAHATPGSCVRRRRSGRALMAGSLRACRRFTSATEPETRKQGAKSGIFPRRAADHKAVAQAAAVRKGVRFRSLPWLAGQPANTGKAPARRVPACALKQADTRRRGASRTGPGQLNPAGQHRCSTSSQRSLRLGRAMATRLRPGRRGLRSAAAQRQRHSRVGTSRPPI